MNLEDVLLKPVFTEKSLNIAKAKIYTFWVARGADKKAIKMAVEKIFGVSVAGVGTVNVKGKTRRVLRSGKRLKLVTQKKAFVKVVGDKKIDLFEVSVEKTKDQRPKTKD